IRVAQRKRGGPITHRSQDRNLALIIYFFTKISYHITHQLSIISHTNDHILHQASREEHQGGFLAVVISRSCPDTKDPQVSFCFKRKSSLTAIFHEAINVFILIILF
ncbi:hypothetical protein BRARA_J00730, partial [Brassica rapa]